MDVAGDGVSDRGLQICCVKVWGIDVAPFDGADSATAPDRADQDEEIGLHVLESLRDRDRAVVHLFDQYVGTERLALQPLDGKPTQVEVALEELTDSTDKGPHETDARFSRRRTSRC